VAVQFYRRIVQQGSGLGALMDCRASLAMTEEKGFAMTEEEGLAMPPPSRRGACDVAVQICRRIVLQRSGLGALMDCRASLAMTGEKGLAMTGVRCQ